MKETIVSLFEENAREKPEKIALVSGETILSYGELNNLSNQCARSLSLHVQKGDRVGICFEENPSIILVSILAILKLGCSYVPVDPKNPDERVKYLIKTSSPKIVICDSTTKNLIAKHRRFVLFIDLVAIKSDSVTNPDVEISQSDPAYIFFTSGSTGMPKGVMVSQQK